MTEQERPLIDRVWEFTKDISVKVSRKAEKHWKINTLRVEIASIRHRINIKFKELGRYVYESVKSQTLEEESYKASLREFFDELKRLEGEILQRENRIEILETEIHESDEKDPPQPPPIPTTDSEAIEAEVISEAESAEEEPDDKPKAEPESKSESEKAEDSGETPETEKEGKATKSKTPTRKRRTRTKSSRSTKSTQKKATPKDEE